MTTTTDAFHAIAGILREIANDIEKACNTRKFHTVKYNGKSGVVQDLNSAHALYRCAHRAINELMCLQSLVYEGAFVFDPATKRRSETNTATFLTEGKEVEETQ